jgi:hypothetical protein
VKLRLFPQLMEVFEEEEKPPSASYDFIFPCLVAMSTSILLLISFFAEVYMDNSFIYLPKLYSSKVHKISFDAGVDKFERITLGIRA